MSDEIKPDDQQQCVDDLLEVLLLQTAEIPAELEAIRRNSENALKTVQQLQESGGCKFDCSKDGDVTTFRLRGGKTVIHINPRARFAERIKVERND